MTLSQELERRLKQTGAVLVGYGDLRGVAGCDYPVGVDRDGSVHKEKCYRKQLQLMRERTGIERDLCGRCFVVCPYTRRYLKRAAGGQA